MVPTIDLRVDKKVPKILIVDDEPNFLFGVSRMLSRAGFDVITANNGSTGILQAQEQQPDLILLDVNMPLMDGFQVKRELDNNSETQFIPTIFLTAQGDRNYMLIGLDLAEDYITKPFDAEILTARLWTTLRKVDLGYKLAVQDSKKAIFSMDRIQQWGQAVEVHDKGTAGHTRRVTCWFTALARSLGVTGEELDCGVKGAMLHDIGKLAVPESILNKPGPLNDGEWEIMRDHPNTAFEMLRVIEPLKSALDIPHYHHERWDGNGYPKGLGGESIPLTARIFSVVDVFDAVISKRPYRVGLEERVVLEMIKDASGTFFDPRIVDHFLANFDSIKMEVGNEYDTENLDDR